MKRLIIVSFLFILTLAVSFEAKSQVISPLVLDAIEYWFVGCVNGGEGSGGCSISVSVGGGGMVLGTGGNGSVSITHSVSGCGDGYYACCNLLGAKCNAEQ
ncbi:hypothetical protein [uncultured Roseivirga sp.]|uniref:hypothetical protein n=1 Tax=uncultured Roseivirga sp. TaxID=543088 RepID=UPI0030DBDC02|tara:strand:- start:8648 stop:8950 length:303 start_codon:yes stop_codon:yes gene_type:complete